MQIYRSQQESIAVEYSLYRSLFFTQYLYQCYKSCENLYQGDVSCSSFQSLNPIGKHFIHKNKVPNYVINPNLTLPNPQLNQPD